jgi:hypothetical protein
MENEQKIFAANVAKLISYIFESGYACTFGEAYRTPEQAAIDAKKCIGIKNSLHTHRLAIDLNLFDSLGHYQSETKQYEKFGVFWESLAPGNRWGGRFSRRADGNHFECHTVHADTQELREKNESYSNVVVAAVVSIVLMYFFLRILLGWNSHE